MKEHILIIGGGFLQVPVIEQAQDMGFKTIVMDMNLNAPGILLADVPLIISTKDVDLAVRAAKIQNRITPIQGVLTVGTDVSVTVATIATELELPGILPKVAYYATNKHCMKYTLSENNVPCANYHNTHYLELAIKGANAIGYPVVIKPDESMGARGVIRINNDEELQYAFRQAMAYAYHEVIIEEYIEGPELSIDAVIYNNEIFITGIADRIITPHPKYFVEIGHTMPSQLSIEQQNAAIDVFKQGIKALDINHGCAKGDIKITAKGAMVGEIAARLSGGFMSTHTYPLSTGVNLMKAAINLAIGEPPGDLTPVHSKVAIERALVADTEGILKELRFEEPIEDIEGIYLTKKTGSWVAPPKNNVEKLGHIIAVADTLEEAEKAIENSKKYIRIRIES